MDIILSTRNPSKAEQIKAIFQNTRTTHGGAINILTLADAGIEGEAVEDGATLKENARKKARFAQEQISRDPKNPHAGAWMMADDTGLFIKALDGKPGIHAARWLGDDATTEEITQGTLARLEGKTDRTAYFETVVALIAPDGREFSFSGKAPGTILTAPRCAPQPKMPYSPIFLADGEAKTWAEMTVDYENTISHRGKAFAQVRKFLETT